MGLKKNIDRLFNEQFKDFEVTPPDTVWENIEAELAQKKKKQRIVPLFWYKTAGVAALLLLFFSVGNFFYNNTQNIPLVTDEPVTLPNTKTQPGNKTTKEKTTVSPLLNNNKALSEAENQPSEVNSARTKNTFDVSDNTENTATVLVEAKPDNPKKERISMKPNPEKEKIALLDAQAFNIPEKEAKKKEADNLLNKEKMAIEKNHDHLEIDEAAVAVVHAEDTLPKTEKKSLLEYLAEKEKQEEVVEANTAVKKEGRWAVSPGVAPLYYNTLGNGSSIDPQFSDNPKSGDINYGYGIQVSYAVTDRLSIRTGINKVDLSYATNGIEFLVATADNGLLSIDYRGSGNIIAVGNAGSLNLISNNPLLDSGGNIIVPRNGGPLQGTIRQSLDYLEIPIELKYNVVGNRFGVNLIGGVSTLLLNDNEISVHSGDYSTVIGQANNLNDLSFSTNVGVGFDYKISKKFQFNIEPMFKYQLNPYTRRSNFKPYYLGVYSGFSYKF